MRILILTLVLTTLFATGCRTHMHAGGGRGFDAGASIGRDTSYYVAPPVIVDTPPQPMPSR